MNEATHESTEVSGVWQATCPRCSKVTRREDFKCENCLACRFDFVKEMHLIVRHERPGMTRDQYQNIWFTECYLKCGACSQKTKSIICTGCQDCVLSIPHFIAMFSKTNGRSTITKIALCLILFIIIFTTISTIYDETGLMEVMEDKDKKRFYSSLGLVLAGFGVPTLVARWAWKRLSTKKTETAWYKFDK